MTLRMNAIEVAAFFESFFPEANQVFAIEEVREGGARVRYRFDGRTRPGGTLSGPSMMTLADTAMWVALLGAIGPEELSVTSNLNIDFLRKPGPRDAIGEAELLKVGRRLAVGTVTIYSDGEPDPVAHATVTYAIPSRYTPPPD